MEGYLYAQSEEDGDAFRLSNIPKLEVKLRKRDIVRIRSLAGKRAALVEEADLLVRRQNVEILRIGQRWSDGLEGGLRCIINVGDRHGGNAAGW